jgi:hypothetical protein
MTIGTAAATYRSAAHGLARSRGSAPRCTKKVMKQMWAAANEAMPMTNSDSISRNRSPPRQKTSASTSSRGPPSWITHATSRGARRHLVMLSHGDASAALSTRCTIATTPKPMSHGLLTASSMPTS